MAQTHHWKFNTATQLEDTIGTLDFLQGYDTSTSINSAGVVNDCIEISYGSIETPSNPFPSSGAFSISFWWKTNSSLPAPIIFNVGGFEVSLSIYDGPWINFRRVTISDYFADGNFTLNVPIRINDPTINEGPNAFTFISISWDGTNWGFLINGMYASIAEGSSFTPVAIYDSNYTLKFYGVTTSGVLPVFIDDVRVFNSAEDGLFAWNNSFGTEFVFDSGSGNAYGPLPTINLNELLGAAGGGIGTFGGLETITVTPFSGSALFILDGSASGSFSTVTVSSFGGIAFPEFIAYGELATITVTSFEAIASSIATIQLDYVACDGEITWTQTLPITGFSSAIQGQDAISSRITPTIGASGASIVFFEQRTIAASGSYTYDLTALTDFLGGALSLSRAYAITITPTSGTARLAPGASNPFQWFFASTTSNISLSQGDAFMFAQPESATITSGSKTLVVTNTSGAASLTYKIAILGGR
jgi:hypothetical protein